MRKHNDLRRRKKRREIVNSYKAKPCMDCGRSFPPVCMDFDHRPGEVKSFGIGVWQTRASLTLQDLLDEIAKCDVVCACCHRLRTDSRHQRTDLPSTRKTHCKHGHELTIANTYVTSRGWRQCRTCKKLRKGQKAAMNNGAVS